MKTFVIIIIVSFLFGCFSTPAQKTGKEGKPLPTFSMLLTDSATWVHSTDIPMGKSFAILYFSPYCPFCKAQTKNIIENIDQLKDIHFYYISSFPLSSVKEFIKEFDLKKYNNISIGIDSAHVVNDYFEVPAFPYIAIYGKNKKLKKTFIGKMYSSQIKKEAEE